MILTLQIAAGVFLGVGGVLVCTLIAIEANARFRGYLKEETAP